MLKRPHTSPRLFIIVAAALLVELTSAGLYYSAQHIIWQTNERLVMQEMKSIAMNVRKQLAKVEVVMNNYAWVVGGDIEEPEWMFETSRNLVENNPFLVGCGIAFVPDYYPEKGRWFEPYSARRADGTIESTQLGGVHHDYTQCEPYTFTIEQDSDHWSKPYLDSLGAGTMVTTYSTPAYDNNGNIVAVVMADIPLDTLKDIVERAEGYKSTRRFLVTRQNRLLAGDDSQFSTLNSQFNKHVYEYPVGGITGWKLICVCSDEEITAPLRRVRLLLLLPVVGGFFLLGFIIWRSSRNLERLRKVNAEKERIDSDLRVAREIQQSMLPKTECEATGDGWKVKICGSLVPAREVGGDLFDYYLRDEKLFFCIGDVSGKGAPSAMVMGVVHSLFRAASADKSNPAIIMRTINKIACEGNESNLFVTLFIGVLDLPTGQLLYCNAGHDRPIVINENENDRASQLSTLNSQLSTLNCPPHLPLGLFEDVDYQMQQTSLSTDSSLFLYTDGLTEAKDNNHRQFGLARVEETLRQSILSHSSPKATLEAMNHQVHAFVGNAPQSDDLTMLDIHFTLNPLNS